jgi:hypothetical protein
MSPHPHPLPLSHRKRLREVWRSAGWPCRDLVEVDLLAAGLLQRVLDAEGRETLRLTDAGVQALAATVARNRAARTAHEALVERVAEQMQRDGRIVWRGLSLRAPLAAPVGAGHAPGAGPNGEPADAHPARPGALPASLPGSLAGSLPGSLHGSLQIGAGFEAPAQPAARVRWVMAMPDVYSIRHTTVEAFTEPAVHEIKVRRADLLADLKRPDKGAAYLALSSQCWYVLGPGVGTAADVPEAFGVLVVVDGGQLVLARPAPRRAVTPGFAVWMALARAAAEPPADEPAQAPLRPAAGH